ncbi:MAG: 4Fe-4S binding protein [Gammaproteobacteria bacterium]
MPYRTFAPALMALLPSGAFPGLSCAYDFQNTDYRMLIPFQHQMAHRVGHAVVESSSLLMSLVPFITTLGTFLLLFVLLNKAFCGWTCPLGFFRSSAEYFKRRKKTQKEWEQSNLRAWWRKRHTAPAAKEA